MDDCQQPVQAGDLKGQTHQSLPSASSVNIYPERRRKTETSPSFEHSKTESEVEQRPAKCSEGHGSPSKGARGNRFTDRGGRGSQSTIQSSRSGPTGPHPRMRRDDPLRLSLKDVAAETALLLPGLLATRPDLEANLGILMQGPQLHVDQILCPRLKKAEVHVVNSDTIDAALGLSPDKGKPVLVLNMANERRPGGGWLNGARAQEEAICYRTSLSLSLDSKHYPIPSEAGIYTADCLVFREGIANGNGLLDLRDPSKLKVISCATVAAVERPPLKSNASKQETWKEAADRALMEEKIRIILRIAIKNRHRQIVLGAFGCGVFANPTEEVAAMFASVFAENEFSGGWWKDVVFAVLDLKGDGNFKAFKSVLNGLAV